MFEEERIKILETVMGSNHRLIQLQTVGKNAGAPMIWSTEVNKNWLTGHGSRKTKV